MEIQIPSTLPCTALPPDGTDEAGPRGVRPARLLGDDPVRTDGPPLPRRELTGRRLGVRRLDPRGLFRLRSYRCPFRRARPFCPLVTVTCSARPMADGGDPCLPEFLDRLQVADGHSVGPVGEGHELPCSPVETVGT